MNKLHLGLIVAAIIGVAIALFPLYSGKLSDFLWSKESIGEEHGEEHGVEEYARITGVVTKVDTEQLAITIDGKEIVIRGMWKITSPNGKEEELEAVDLLGMIKPGMQVTAKVIEKGRWTRAEELDFDGYHAYRVSD